MQQKWTIILGVCLLIFSAAPVPAQWTSGEISSTLMQTPSGSIDPSLPPVYYPYWHNYLDNLQREGGYYAITGNYPNSVPVTSYYPASPSSEAATQQSNIYYNPRNIML